MSICFIILRSRVRSRLGQIKKNNQHGLQDYVLGIPGYNLSQDRAESIAEVRPEFEVHAVVTEFLPPSLY